ncbi:acyl-CoA dehydrogenase C-terminal domain-containing protein [Pseudomonas xantholysinigenes]|uniref:acyl-CoA dehydrogenase C-terminal domain-containing protein n=1 Tax=Pseudomonas xantholysinigenes TaxID=2745490 RepID=UPI0021F26532|nr:acyl-CoA dehydrogenase C-terminal domain-containing protein [Pseudomonas xantholysinigenes]
MVNARLASARLAFQETVEFVTQNAKAAPNDVFSGSVPYLMLAGNLLAGWQLARSLLAAEKLVAKGEDVPFMQARITTARFYAEHILTRIPGQRDAIINGASSVMALPVAAF